MHACIHTHTHTHTHTHRESARYMYKCIYLAHGLKMLLEHAYVGIRQHTSAYFRIRQHTSAYVSIRQHTYMCIPDAPGARICQHTSAYVSIRQHTSAYIYAYTWRTASRCSWSTHCSSARSARRLHTSAYVSMRQHTSAYVSIRQHTSATPKLSVFVLSY